MSLFTPYDRAIADLERAAHAESRPVKKKPTRKTTKRMPARAPLITRDVPWTDAERRSARVQMKKMKRQRRLKSVTVKSERVI